MEHERVDTQRGKRGSVMIVAALAMTALLLFAALAIDVGAVWLSRTQSQNAADSAALAAASKMIFQDPVTYVAEVRLADARTEGINFAGANATVGEAVGGMSGNLSGGVTVGNTDNDFTFGFWDPATRTLYEEGQTMPDGGAVDLTNPDHVTGVRVNVFMGTRPGGTLNAQSPAFLSRLMGRFGFDVANTATAYLGFEGSFAAGEFELPIALDSCDLSTGGCGADFCATIASPPNPCALKWSQGEDPVTCLEFSSTPEQNACWTNYSDTNASVNNPVLQGIVDNGSPEDIQVGDEAYLDNGDKADTEKYIRNLFYGCREAPMGQDCFIDGPGGDPRDNNRCPDPDNCPVPKGIDRYLPNPPHDSSQPPAPNIDSWVVKLPVFECQDGVGGCAGGNTATINGGVCFEIREMLFPAGDFDDSSRRIKGRFLCPNSPDPQEVELFNQYCRDEDTEENAPGGCNFGVRANELVLVQ